MNFPRYSKTEDEIRMDMEANWFAASFLMPETQFRYWFDFTEGNIIQIARRFKVTTYTARLRAEGLGLVERLS
jgi:Zn-dependent peptidase ImmA (M78 family)